MVNPYSPYVSSTFSRVSTLLSRDVILANLRRLQEDILLSQQQLATGIRVIYPSIDPVSSAKIMDFKTSITKIEQFSRNIERGLAKFGITDSVLSNTSDIINRAREIALEQSQSTATTQTRLAAANEVSLLIDRVVDIANTYYDGMYIFGGSKTKQSPINYISGLVSFSGDLKEISINVSESLRLASNITADEAFGAVGKYEGLEPTTLNVIDLNPRITTETKLSSLRSGEGIPLGSIFVSGTGSAIIDLSIAKTVGDVIDLINAQSATTGITASINPAQNGLQIDSASGTVLIQEVSNGKTAEALGILTPSTGVASPLIGDDLDPILTYDTRLGDFYGGAGIDSSGIILTNSGAGQVYQAVLDASVFDPNNTVEQLINAINNSGTYVFAKINDAKTGIDLYTTLSGARFRVDENGGTTALEMGWRYTLERVKVVDIYDGYGAGGIDGADIKITRKDGEVLTIDVDEATTIKDIVDMINQDPYLSAVITANDEIQVTDSSPVAGTFKIENTDGSVAATRLEIEGEVTGGVGPVTISGTQVGYVGIQPEGIFSALLTLKNGLLNDDVNGIMASSRLLDISQDLSVEARGIVGARANTLELARNRYEIEEVELNKLLSQERDLDYAEAITQFQIQQYILQAALAAAARILQTTLLYYL
jgi:flagellar hook-associated protein 3